MSVSKFNKNTEGEASEPDQTDGKNPGFTTAGVIHVRLNGSIVATDDLAKSFLDYPLDFQLVDRGFLEFCSSMEEENWAEMIQVLEHGGVCGFDGIFVTYTGDFINLSCLAVYQVGASVADIYLSEGPNNSEFLNAALRKLEICEAFLDTDLLDINIKNTDLEYEVTSGMFEKTFSLDKGGAIGKKPEDIFPPAFASHVASHDRVVLDRKQVTTQIDVVPFSGKHLLVQKFPLFKNGSIQGIGVFAVDVTSLKRSEKRLLESKNRYSDYVDLCDDVLWEADENWVVRESSISGASSVSGVSLSIGSNILDQIGNQLRDRDGLDLFVANLDQEGINKIILELGSGGRLKLGIKVCRTDSFDASESGSDVVYRGIITFLPGRTT